METIRVIWAGEREAHVIAPDGQSIAHYLALLAAGIEGLAEITPGSRSVQIRFDANSDPEATLPLVRSVVEKQRNEPLDCSQRIVEVPICSDPDLAPDLERIARNAGLQPDAAADLHASSDYTVRFLGFSPGFPYLDGLPEPLHRARLETPRPRVRSGSVGIAGARTGIYPQASPGGWQLIGATPLRLFDPRRDPPALLAPGDRIHFRRIARDEFNALALEHA